MYSYKTKGTCSREIQFDVENNIVKEIRFIGGCMGNTQGVAALCKGRNIDERHILSRSACPCSSCIQTAAGIDF